jgi:hypothetical protein
VKNAVNVKIEKRRFIRNDPPSYTVWLVGASGRKIIADVLTPNRNYFARWYESDTYVGVGFKTLAEAKKWYTQHMFEQHPEFVGDERCDICLIVGDCPSHCPIREKGY